MAIWSIGIAVISAGYLKEVGLSFTDYMIQQRINKATDFLIKQICPLKK